MEVIFGMIEKFLKLSIGNPDTLVDLEVSDEIEGVFLSILRKVDVPKGTVLNVPGKSVEKIYFVEKGLIINSCMLDGKEIGTSFFDEGDVGGDIISFLTGHRSKRIVKVLENSSLWVLTKKDLNNLVNNYPQAEKINRLLYSYIILNQQERIEELMFGSSLVRYKNFESKFPNVIYRLPLGFLASYLGMSRETLSRIRSKK